jgi:colanic acid/amylovoran/stewartan biosynthesis glycosyltransferase WcaL/AmsK/CpsK
MHDDTPRQNPSPPDAAGSVPIAVVVGSWLPFSETFIFDLLRRQRLTRAWVIAGARTKDAERFPYAPVTHLGPIERLGFRHAGLAPGVDRVLERSAARLVLAHFGLNGAFVLPFARRRGLPLVVMFHGHDVGGLLACNRATPRYFRYQRTARELFDYASLLLCASEDLRQNLLACGAPEHKLAVHHLGIDVEHLQPASREARPPTVLMVGRCVEKKGMSYGLRAFCRLRERVPEARLRIIGDGPLRPRLLREASALGVAEATTFLGSLAHARVLDEMRRALVLITPSITTARGDRESGVIVLKEAGALGLPVVATRHGGIPEIVEHERTGLLVEERSVPELAEALVCLFQRPELAARLGGAARQKVLGAYDNRTRVPRFEQTLLSLL